MANIFLYFVLTFAFVALIGLIIWALIVFLNYKKEIKDDVFGINFMSFKSDGRFVGIERDHKTGKDGRHIISLDPKDVDLSKDEDMKPVKVIVDARKIISMPKGTVSRDKNINIYLPKSATDFPDAIKDSDLGKAFMWLTELKNLVNTEVEMLAEGHTRKDALLIRIGTGEISRSFMKFNEELVKDALEAAVNSKDKPKTAGNLGGLPSNN